MINLYKQEKQAEKKTSNKLTSLSDTKQQKERTQEILWKLAYQKFVGIQKFKNSKNKKLLTDF